MVERNIEQVGGAGSGQNSVADPEANQAAGMQKQPSMIGEEELLEKEAELKRLEQEVEESK